MTQCQEQYALKVYLCPNVSADLEGGGANDGLAARAEGGEFEGVFSGSKSGDRYRGDDGDDRVAGVHEVGENLNAGICLLISVLIENPNVHADLRERIRLRGDEQRLIGFEVDDGGAAGMENGVAGGNHLGVVRDQRACAFEKRRVETVCEILRAARGIAQGRRAEIEGLPIPRGDL